MPKARRSAFLARNPYPRPLTLGFFYREKMRAIHRVAPDVPVRDVLEVGGGRSGLGRLLYPDATITTLDLDPRFGDAPCNRQSGVRFVGGDATRLPFRDASFDVVTMFDLLEHVPDDSAAVREGVRVMRDGAHLLISTPLDTWRYPYYRALRPVCPSEEHLFREWGHVRRGYSLDALSSLVPLPCQGWSAFIGPITALCHDVAFSNLPERVRVGLCTMLAPVTWLGYALHRPHGRGTETASAWRKAVA